MPNPETAWDHGDVIRDREDDDPDPAIVVNTPGAPANEWDVPRFGKTVAEDNPEYPPDAEIVTVVFEENLNDAFPNWEANNPITYAALDERGVQYYSFPDPRLEPAEPTDATETTDSEPEPDPEEATPDNIAPDDEATSTAIADETHASDASDASTATDTEEVSSQPSAAVRALKRRLDDGGMTTELESDDRTIRATKLGNTYRVQPGEVLDGDGPLRSRLEDLVDADDLHATN